MAGTDFYNELQSAVIEHARSKGEYDSRLQAITELYNKHDPGADPLKELTADLVGDYLFTDTEFINNLSTNHRNVFQKVYDEVKYLCKVATAGSKEARQLEKVKKAFEDAYRADSKLQTNSKTQSSISETTDGRFAAVVDSDILSNIDTSSWDKTKKDAAKKAASDALKKFSGGIVVDGITRNVNRTSRREYTRSEYTEKLFNHAPDVFADKMRAADVADDIVVVATNWNRDGGLKHPRNDDFVDFDHGTTLIVSGNAKYSAEVIVGITDTGEAVFYDVVDMTPASFDLKKEESPTTATTQNAIGDIQGDSFGDNVPQEPPVVNGQFSLSDSTGREISAETQERLQYSVIRDESGRIKPMYHGSPNGNITSFNAGTYFTENKEYADRYQNTGASSISTGKVAANPKTYEVYLDIRKPFALNDAEARRIYIEDYIKGGNAIGINPYLSDAEYAKIKSIDWTEGEDLKDFLIDNGYDYDGLVLDEGADGGYGEDVKYRGKSYVIFSPEQVVRTDLNSLSNVGETDTTTGNYNVYGKDIALPSALEDIAPVAQAETATETAQNVPIAENVPVNVENSTNTEELFPDNLAPIEQEIDRLSQKIGSLMNRIEEKQQAGQFDDAEMGSLVTEYLALEKQLEALEQEANAADADRLSSLVDMDAPPEMEAPYQGESESLPVENPFWDRDFGTVGNRKVKAYMYENPEVKTFFQEEAMKLYGELSDTTKGERFFNDEVYYESGGEKGITGVKRRTSKSIEEMLDSWGMSYDDIRKGLDAIIEDHGAENIAAAKKIEFMLNDRLLHGYKDFYTNRMVEPNQDYINLLEEKQIMEYTEEARQSFWANVGKYDPMGDIAPTAVTEENTATQYIAPVAESYEAIKPKRQSSNEPRMVRADSKGKQRKWVKTSTESDVVDGKILPEDLNQELIPYQPIPNKKSFLDFWEVCKMNLNQGAIEGN